MTVVARITGAVLAGVFALGLAWASDASLDAYRSTDAMVRLSWSARPERIETCRTLSDEELARTPAHMRQRQLCDGTTARYRLEVTRDGAPLAAEDVRGGGLRHDRELYVLREFAVPSGASTIRVHFVRLDSSLAGPHTAAAATPVDTSGAVDLDRARREVEERLRRREEAIPASLDLDTSVTLAPREVVLVTYDAERHRLVAKQGTP